MCYEGLLGRPQLDSTMAKIMTHFKKIGKLLKEMYAGNRVNVHGSVSGWLAD